MKNFIPGLLILLLMLASCSTDKEKVTLEPGTPGYVFAKDLAKVLPAVDPDSNKVIVETVEFEVTTGEVVDLILTNFGTGASDLQKMQPQRIKSILEMNAEKLAEQKLIIDAAKDQGISISDEQIDSMLQAQYQKMGGEEAFINYISQNGITIELVKKDMANGYVANKYMEGVLREKSGITEQALQDQYRQMIQKDSKASVQHILLMTQGKSAQEKAVIFKKIKTILAKARAGEDFGKLAATYSEDTGSKDKGGLYENFERGAMVKPFEDAAFTVPVGELSDVIETRYGYHILKVVSRTKETRSFEEVRPEIEKKLAQGKSGELTRAHMTKLKEEHEYIKYSL